MLAKSCIATFKNQKFIYNNSNLNIYNIFLLMKTSIVNMMTAEEILMIFEESCRVCIVFNSTTHENLQYINDGVNVSLFLEIH